MFNPHRSEYSTWSSHESPSIYQEVRVFNPHMGSIRSEYSTWSSNESPSIYQEVRVFNSHMRVHLSGGKSVQLGAHMRVHLSGGKSV